MCIRDSHGRASFTVCGRAKRPSWGLSPSPRVTQPLTMSRQFLISAVFQLFGGQTHTRTDRTKNISCFAVLLTRRAMSDSVTILLTILVPVSTVHVTDLLDTPEYVQRRVLIICDHKVAR